MDVTMTITFVFFVIFARNEAHIHETGNSVAYRAIDKRLRCTSKGNRRIAVYPG